MFKISSRTIAETSVIEGRGLHGGEPVQVGLHPGPPGSGIVFEGAGPPVRVGLDTATTGPARSCVGWVHTPEHLLAAVTALGITDLRVVLSAPELPGLDGSAAPWAESLGDVLTTGETDGFTVDQPVSVELDGGHASIEPAETLQIEVEVDFGPGTAARCVWDGGTDLLAARTFLRHGDLPRAQALGLGRGLGPGQVVVLGPRGSLVPLRMPNEWAAHKVVDLLGDLALLGRPLRGRVVVHRGTHALHQALLRACSGLAGQR